jgi:hypothetical protein
VTRLSPIIAFVLMLLAGLAGGLFVTYSILGLQKPLGAQRYGVWVTWSANNSNDFDPYSRAFFARRGDIPLTPLEGIALFAKGDSEGKLLNPRCSYEMAGAFPSARAWTLFMYSPSGALIATESRRSGFTSSEVVQDNGLTKITISPEPQPGNWLPTSGTNPFILTLRFYDSPLSTVGSVLEVERLPTLTRIGCRS